ncbi:DUF799 family lipoprotein [Marinobacteraceae bacterium S3BR75-40.1]
MMKKYLYLILLITVALSISACAPQRISKQEAFPKMYEEAPQSILVVPAVNQSTAADAPDLYSSTIAQPLAYSGYYVMPIEVTTAILRSEGIQSGAQLTDVPPQKFKEFFDADAVLYVTITQWDTNYYVVGGNVTVGVQYLLKSTETGETLWNYHDTRAVDTSGDANNGLLAAIIVTAIKTATQDYVPVASQVNFAAINTMPLGKYHPKQGKDGQFKVVSPAKIDSGDKAVN